MNKFGGLIPCTKCPNTHPVGYVCAAAPQQKIITTKMQLAEAVDEIANLKDQIRELKPTLVEFWGWPVGTTNTEKVFIDALRQGIRERDDEITKLKELMFRAVPIVSKVSGIEAHTLWKELREAAKP